MLVHGDERKRDVSTMYGIRRFKGGGPSPTIVLNYQHLVDGPISIVEVSDTQAVIKYGQHDPWRYQRFCWDPDRGAWTKSAGVLSRDVPGCTQTLGSTETRPLASPHR